MKLALLGHGQMARVVEAQARAAGLDIGVVVTSRNAADAVRLLPGHTAAIDFSTPAAVIDHVTAAVAAGVPLVEGTTGWQDDAAEVRRIVTDGAGALIHGANFSIGVNLFYRLVANAAQLFRGVAGYDPFIEEAHHARKRDAPSGTALALRTILSQGLGHREVPVTSTRAGHIPGTHRVGLDSTDDQLLLVHTARSRSGFARGALLAARWILGRRGMYAFDDVLDDILALALETERKIP
ncbi:MAG TPA: dihydrodipicolinate reductase C-terminal domain-containing protein [Gemmatimonadales bacterium]|nr:dihydrodipicolinate reductase C-terminal domain-containing protein [Gemmatimonadales bacterium]